MKKRDFIFIVVVIVFAIMCGIVSSKISGDKGKTALISVNGNDYGKYSLDIELELNIDTEFGHNTLKIDDGYASVIASDCMDHICEKTGRISETGDIICCLPHKLIIEIK